MRRKLIARVTILILFTVGLSSAFLTGCAKKGQTPTEIWVVENKTFKVRVMAYAEKGAFLSGTYYVFESAELGSDRWRKIMTFRHDDQPKIPKDQIVLLDDKIGYAFMGWMYAVTTDGGSSWYIWDAQKDLPNWQCCNYGLIRDVLIGADGTGTMTLNPIPQRRGELRTLHTMDYGRHWK